MWPWPAKMGIEIGHTRLSCHEGVPSLNLNLINIAIFYPLILLCLIHSNLTAESGCSISLSSSGRGREGHRRERNGETLGNHHHSMELRK